MSSKHHTDGTRLENVEDIRRWVEHHATQTKKDLPPDDDAQPFCPINRPSMALICLLDDGREGGELIRVRDSEIVIGRNQGDLLIPHDEAVSGRHCKLYRTLDDGRSVWRVKDLQSSNGTFARTTSAVLSNQQEILVGHRRFRYEAVQEGAAAAIANHANQSPRMTTRAWQTVTPDDAGKCPPSLVELMSTGEGPPIALTRSEHWIGSDTEHCAIKIDDPFVSPRHARIHRDQQGRWHIENGKSRNGTWLRIKEITVASSAEFQVGEQRFLVRILGRENPTSS